MRGRGTTSVALLAMAAAALGGCEGMQGAQDRRWGGGLPGRAIANPSALIEAELAFARAAREKGQWTAFRAFAAAEAVMFVPQAVLAPAWLRGRADPAEAVRWQPHRVWLSCDGSLGVTTGAWQGTGGAAGYFTTAWQRQKDGSYRWTMDQGDDLAVPLREPDMLNAEIASCDPLPPAPVDAAPVVGDWRGGGSLDGTLYWSIRVDRQCGRIVTVRVNRGGGQGFEEVLNRRVNPPRPPATCGS